MNSIFISYRREDSKYVCDRIYEALSAVFGRAEVFRDIDGIPAGADFRQVLQERLAQCRVVLVVLGPTWSTLTDNEGHLRLRNPNDFVRLEVETALRLGIPVIPVLVQDAWMPSASDLPPTLEQLTYQNARQVRADPDFQHDIERLIGDLGSYVPRQAPILADTSLRKPVGSSVVRMGCAALGGMILLLVFVLGGAGFIVWKSFFPGGADAHGTLTAFCTAMQEKQYQTAYSALSSTSTLRQSVGPDERMATNLGIQDLGDPHVAVVGCHAFTEGWFDGNYGESGSTAHDLVTFIVTDAREATPHTVANYTMYFVKENGQWKIDSIVAEV